MGMRMRMVMPKKELRLLSKCKRDFKATWNQINDRTLKCEANGNVVSLVHMGGIRISFKIAKVTVLL